MKNGYKLPTSYLDKKKGTAVRCYFELDFHGLKRHMFELSTHGIEKEALWDVFT